MMKQRRNIILLISFSFCIAGIFARSSNWRDFMNNKKAASVLEKKIRHIDKSDLKTISVLQREIKAFRDERLQGELDPYPSLYTFLYLRTEDIEPEEHPSAQMRDTALQELAQNLEIEKKRQKEEQIRLEKKRVQEKREREERLRLAALEKKKKQKEEEFLRRAKRLEKRRMKKIMAWRHYRRKKKAASCLIKAMDSIDMQNELHVADLKREVKKFRDEVLHGRLERYPQLESFLGHKVSQNKVIEKRDIKENILPEKHFDEGIFDLIHELELRREREFSSRQDATTKAISVISRLT